MRFILLLFLIVTSPVFSYKFDVKSQKRFDLNAELRRVNSRLFVMILF